MIWCGTDTVVEWEQRSAVGRHMVPISNLHLRQTFARTLPLIRSPISSTQYKATAQIWRENIRQDTSQQISRHWGHVSQQEDKWQQSWSHVIQIQHISKKLDLLGRKINTPKSNWSQIHLLSLFYLQRFFFFTFSPLLFLLSFSLVFGCCQFEIFTVDSCCWDISQQPQLYVLFGPRWLLVLSNGVPKWQTGESPGAALTDFAVTGSALRNEK